VSNYVKLFGSIVASTIWEEDNETRIVWITMLAMANMHGEVEASIPGLAKFSKVPIPATEAALAKLLAPDPYSRSKENEGRRIEEIDGGWVILNHGKYRDKESKSNQREQDRIRAKRYRDRKAGDDSRHANVTDSSRSVTLRHAPSRHTEAEAEADSEKEIKTGAGSVVETPPASKPQIESDWLLELGADPAYIGIDVGIQLAKMKRWCLEHRKQPTRRRFINWLNRCDRPLSGASTPSQPTRKHFSGRIDPTTI